MNDIPEKKMLFAGIVFMLAVLTASIFVLFFQPFGEPEPQSVRVYLESDVEDVIPGNKIEFSAILINPSGNPVNASIEQRIVDASGSVVARRTDEIELFDQASLGIQLNIPEDAESGPAVVKTGVRYNGRFTLASFNFDIV